SFRRAKLFKGRKLHGDVEIRVEQAQFSELSLVASTTGALTVTIDSPRGGTRCVLGGSPLVLGGGP
ncbi:SYN1 protein, partial [Crypturellus undulatus]|nr:SYN1 protein [Crypturellus undulatus]